MKPFAEITGWGKCMPPAVMTNDDMASIIDTSDEWIRTRSGIHERRVSHVPGSELARVAGARALAAAGRTPADVDLLVVATCTPDTVIPSAAAHVQRRLGTKNAAVFDLNAGCSGFVYALTVATAMIKGGGYRCVLLIGVIIRTNPLHPAELAESRATRAGPIRIIRTFSRPAKRARIPRRIGP